MWMPPGTRIGPYELIGAVGAGGMGEVYRARDTRLDRTVAVKVLSPHRALDPDARARFEREAKAIAALSHPNILAIHDFGTEANVAYVVTELLEGETLRTRLDAARDGDPGHAAGRLPLRKAIDIAVQTAQGLAAAHDRNIVHRDLKPENIFIGTDGHVKLLDFGLARSTAAAPSGTSATELRTDPGTVMGTAGYMAPEQVKGAPADHRADIFSFGCVLYEMIAGRRAFERGTPAETMTAILREDLPPLPDGVDLPPAVDQIVRHCVEKQPAERFQSAHDLTFALRAVAGSASESVGTAAQSRARRHAAALQVLVWTFAVAIAAGTIAWKVAGWTAPPASGPVMRSVLPLGDLAVSRLVGKDDTTIAASRDGRFIAYVNSAHSEIRLHDLETGQSRTLVKADEVGAPCFSPDGKFVAYVSGIGGSIRTAVWGSLHKISVSGGAPATLVDEVIGLKGLSWGDDGWIYYCPSPAFGLWRVRADGGAPEKLTDPDVAKGEKTHRLPFVLPGSQAVLFVVGTSKITSFDDARIEALRLSDRSRHRLIEGGTAPGYLPTGHLLYERAGQLLAVPFDPGRLTVSGVPVTVAEGIADFPPAGTSYHAVSSNGTLFYLPRQASPPAGAIVAVNGHGQVTKLADAPYIVTGASVSPDGRLLAVDPDGATQQIAIIDLARNSTQRITFEWDNASPLWTPDGSRLVFRSDAGGGARRLYMQAADGSGLPEALSTAKRDQIPTSIHDGRLLYEDVDPQTHGDIWMMSLADRTSRPFVRTPFDEGGARFSPDGRWIAYQSNQSGAWEIYVQSAATNGRRFQASEGGGVRAIWQPDGRGLTYLRGLDLMRVAFSVSSSGAELGPPVRLFSLEPDDLLLDVMRDGRWLLLRPAPTPPSTALNVVTNWFDHVRRRMGQ